MINLQTLEELRTRKEIEDYFKQLGENITEEEIDKLKASYEQAEENSEALTLKQLDDVAGGWQLKVVEPSFEHPFGGKKFNIQGGKSLLLIDNGRRDLSLIDGKGNEHILLENAKNARMIYLSEEVIKKAEEFDGCSYDCLLQRGGSFGSFINDLKVGRLQLEPEYCFNKTSPMFKFTGVKETGGLILAFPGYEQFKDHLKSAAREVYVKTPDGKSKKIGSDEELFEKHSEIFERILQNQPDGSIKLMTASTGDLADFLFDIYRSYEYEPLSDASTSAILFGLKDFFKCS